MDGTVVWLSYLDETAVFWWRPLMSLTYNQCDTGFLYASLDHSSLLICMSKLEESSYIAYRVTK
jgi:hypothetical protein